MDLQLFHQEKTEEASQRKLAEARKEGKAPRSQDLAAGIGLVGATVILQSTGGSLYELIAEAMTSAFTGLGRRELTPNGLMLLYQDSALTLAKAILPIAGILAILGLAVGLIQGRLAVSFKPVTPDFERINPISGFGRIFSLRTLVEQAKGLAKLAVVGFIGYREATALVPEVPNLMGQHVTLAITVVAGRVVSALQMIGLSLLALGVLDYGYQHWEFRKSLRMTKQEVKEEHKQQEGNPELKQKQRQRAREMARRRKALKDVVTADVVITNPTHFAVAIRYQAGKDSAPVVVAKGTDLLAQRIKIIARNHEIPAVENRPLARSLYAAVAIGQSVPPELYQAVAEVLAFVYSLRHQKRQMNGGETR